jgi:hypothetical protein
VTDFFDDHGADGQLQKWRLYYLGLPTPVYWTDLTDHDIETVGGVAGTHRWTAQPITPGPVNNQPSGASASFQIADSADGSLFATLAACNGGELALATIYEAGFAVTNRSAVPDQVVQIFSGRVDRSIFPSNDNCEIVLMPSTQTDATEVPTRLLSTLLRT